ncbi:MAG: RNA-binding S4 domain-containing protein [Trueperaceae bacterium]|nr:RNA-binding S4 domain-containing protein [Trueperaceae bacterium]
MTEQPDADGDDTLPLVAAVKLAGFAETGGRAGRMIRAGEVRVNGEVETRKKRKLRPGDEIAIHDQTFVIESADDAAADHPAWDEATADPGRGPTRA